jgi:hypothetical protein
VVLARGRHEDEVDVTRIELCSGQGGIAGLRGDVDQPLPRRQDMTPADSRASDDPLRFHPEPLGDRLVLDDLLRHGEPRRADRRAGHGALRAERRPLPDRIRHA